ncbi:hypothetical protein [uncultured Ruegeria sp.]|uniref:hypothetical protein n=1 Tax=uncultured Ruegeria sp. TaxID=259304 RepID=UPI00260D7BF0|nr:hypothetical protein [uncultured Ruegeria sp.]
MSGEVTVIDWLQLAAPFVAAGLGLIAYGRQKKVDRKEHVLSECRVIYTKYLAEAENLLRVMCTESDEAKVDAQTVKYREAFLALKVYGSMKVVDQAKPLLMTIVNFARLDEDAPDLDEHRDDIRTKLDGIADAMREDCVKEHWRTS